jgi:hypothetical protein
MKEGMRGGGGGNRLERYEKIDKQEGRKERVKKGRGRDEGE